jgi:hypothetical protein
MDQKFLESVDYLYVIKSPSILVDDQMCISSLTYIRSKMYEKDERLFNYLLDQNMHVLFSDLLNYLACVCSDFTFEWNAQHTQRAKLLELILTMVNFAASKSIKFNIRLNATDIIDGHFQLIRNDTFVRKCQERGDASIFDTAVSNISWLSQYCDDYKKKWIDLDAVNLLVKISKVFSTCTASAYQAISNIADDKQIETLYDIQVCVRELVRYLKMMSDGLINGKMCVNRTLEVIENDRVVIKDSHYNTYDGMQSFYGILVALNKLAVNDKIRKELFFDHKVKEDLKCLLRKGYWLEKKLTLKLMAQLSFNKQIGADLMKDKELVDFLNSVVTDLNYKNDFDIAEAKGICHQIKWNLNEGWYNRIEQIPNSNSHIMISYNAGSRDLCYKIKIHLESSGYRVWMDVSEIQGINSFDTEQ